MKYYINHFDELLIDDDSGNTLLIFSKHNYWFKHEYDHKGYRIYYEDYTGYSNKYDI